MTVRIKHKVCLPVSHFRINLWLSEIGCRNDSSNFIPGWKIMNAIPGTVSPFLLYFIATVRSSDYLFTKLKLMDKDNSMKTKLIDIFMICVRHVITLFSRSNSMKMAMKNEDDLWENGRKPSVMLKKWHMISRHEMY